MGALGLLCCGIPLHSIWHLSSSRHHEVMSVSFEMPSEQAPATICTRLQCHDMGKAKDRGAEGAKGRMLSNIALPLHLFVHPKRASICLQAARMQSASVCLLACASAEHLHRGASQQSSPSYGYDQSMIPRLTDDKDIESAHLQVTSRQALLQHSCSGE